MVYIEFLKARSFCLRLGCMSTLTDLRRLIASVPNLSELAREAKVSRRNIDRLRDGDQHPRLDTADAIRKAAERIKARSDKGKRSQPVKARA